MARPRHTLQRYRSGWRSPAQSRQTVGNSATSAKTLEPAYNSEKIPETSLNPMRVPFLRTTSTEVEDSLKTSRVVSGTSWNLILNLSKLYSGRGEGVVRSGDVVEITDYYPYGAQRAHEGTFTEQRKFTGHEYDSEADLTYANARYYEQNIGRWISQDPVFVNIGTENQAGQTLNDSRTTGFDPRSNLMSGWAEYLADPQIQNSYSYGRNNPLKYNDPTGESPALALVPVIKFILTTYGAAQIGVGAYDAYNTNIKYGNIYSQEEKNRVNTNLGYTVGLTAVGGAATGLNMKAHAFALDALGATMDVMERFFGGRIQQNTNSNSPQINSNLSLNQSAGAQIRGSGSNKELISGLQKIVKSLQSLVKSLSDSKNKK